MLKGLGADITGSADICKCIPVNEIHKESFANMAPNDETVYIYLRSKKEEHMFSNKAYYQAKGNTAAGTKRLVKRFDYFSNMITDVMFETSGYGLTDRDCELKFTIGGTFVSIDIWKQEDATVRTYFRTLTEIADLQKKNSVKLHHVTTAINGRGINKLELKDGNMAASVFQAIGQDARAWGLSLVESFMIEDFSEFFIRNVGNGATGTVLAEVVVK